MTTQKQILNYNISRNISDFLNIPRGRDINKNFKFKKITHTFNSILPNESLSTTNYNVQLYLIDQ